MKLSPSVAAAGFCARRFYPTRSLKGAVGFLTPLLEREAWKSPFCLIHFLSFLLVVIIAIVVIL